MSRAYRRKKHELEDIKELFYRMETEFHTEKQKSMLFEEENIKLREKLGKGERIIKDLQMKQ